MNRSPPRATKVARTSTSAGHTKRGASARVTTKNIMTWAVAAREGDAARAASLFSQDATIMPPGLRPSTGARLSRLSTAMDSPPPSYPVFKFTPSGDGKWEILWEMHTIETTVPPEQL